MFTQKRSRFLSVPTFLLAIFLTFTFSACDSGGGPKPAPDVIIDARTVDENSVVINDGYIVSRGDTVITGGSGQFTVQPGQTIPVTGNAPGRVAKDTSIRIPSADRISGSERISFALRLRKNLPETATVSFENRAAHGDSLIAGTLELAGEVVPETEGKSSGSFTTASSREAKQLCFKESDLFERFCESITLTSDVSVELRPDRKTVKYTVIPDPPYGSPAETKVTMYEPFMADSTKFTGEKTVERPKRKDGLFRQITTDLITGDPEKDGHLDRLVADTSFTANADVELTATPSLIPACSDEINSDQDPFEKDENDPGCANRKGTGYNPDDDNETHSLYQRSTGTFFDDSTYVSSANEERVAQIRKANNPLPQSVTVAIGRINFAVEAKRSVGVSGQEFAIHIKSGSSNDNLTVAKTSEVVADPDTADGWSIFSVYGIDRTFFADGPHYAVFAWHGTKARGKPPAGGGDAVYFYLEIENARLHSFAYYYEPDHPDLQDGSSSAKAAGISQSEFATLENGECRQLENGKVCKNGVPENF